MSEAIHSAIRQIDREIEAMQQRVTDYERAREALVGLVGEPDGDDEEDELEADAAPAPPVTAKPPAMPTVAQTRQAFAGDHTADQYERKLLDLIRSSGSMSGHQLSVATGWSSGQLRHALRRLKVKQQVVCIGNTSGARWSLPGGSVSDGKRAAEAMSKILEAPPPAPPASPTPSPSGPRRTSVDEATVKARDAAILSALKLAPMTRTGLQFVLPDEPWSGQAEIEQALDSALLRLKTKKQIEERASVWRLA